MTIIDDTNTRRYTRLSGIQPSKAGRQTDVLPLNYDNQANEYRSLSLSGSARVCREDKGVCVIGYQVVSHKFTVYSFETKQYKKGSIYSVILLKK